MSEEDWNVVEQWDRLSEAIDRVLTALPSQLTNATALLEAERRTMREIITAWTRC